MEYMYPTLVESAAKFIDITTITLNAPIPNYKIM